jgi:hypothetical protein
VAMSYLDLHSFGKEEVSLQSTLNEHLFLHPQGLHVCLGAGI